MGKICNEKKNSIESHMHQAVLFYTGLQGGFLMFVSVSRNESVTIHMKTVNGLNPGVIS